MKISNSVKANYTCHTNASTQNDKDPDDQDSVPSLDLDVNKAFIPAFRQSTTSGSASFQLHTLVDIIS